MAKENKLTDEDNALLSALGVEVEAKKSITHTKQEERIIAGFEEIQKFVEKHGRLPEHGEDKDIFERLYAVRLDQIIKIKNHKALLGDLDYQNILSRDYENVSSIPDNLSDDELLAKLGVDEEDDSITKLKYVKPRSVKRAVEEMANREVCQDFDEFKPLFDDVKNDIEIGYRNTIRFRKDAGFTKASLSEKQFVIIGGQIAYIAKIGEFFKAPNSEDDARLRVIYANGTESNILLRSLIRAMYKDETSRFISEPNLGPLFSGENSDDDLESGTVYVLRSLSDNPLVTENKNVIHKIGVTGQEVKNRISNAKNDPTYLMAEVEIVATYKLANINRMKLEKVIQKFLGNANLDIEVKDRFGKLVKVKEWFLVPIFIIDKMIDKIKDGTIGDFYYEPTTAELKRR
ncbi:T5orf172 domain-containing protein [Aequorivita sublithincola DSM 14238]|uniref:T5orf172 domain-containing protein n=1 Tax=Aequorivita sublithincola (strain DSM 14238 / LMG 21431 / ACAM 643 / 9-3) TaxID=746697 RepID=I3YU50_AEQSU|nr:GIY-YIG nuclease family protein [Aequorivita sublithincola]AFL80518.1 T5orf172 domain-containing protein [Aequorivita sublithincola DSM 14238]